MTDGKNIADSSSDCAEDLSALARREALSEPEQRRLDLCLASSDALRALHEVGCDFDAVETRRPGDEAMLARIAARAKMRAGVFAPRRATRRYVLAAWVGGTILLAGTLAAATTVLRIAQPVVQVRSTRSEPVAPSAPPPRSTAPSRRTARVSLPSASAEHPGEDPRGRTPTETRPEPTASRPRAASSTQIAPDASELFSDANRARRAGDLDGSLRTYRALQLRYPGSAEAMLSQVLVGRLHLRRGEDALALGAFSHYLAAAPGGSLAEEALEGKARALRRLGRSVEERATWRELLSRYPQSIYAETARERLGEE